MDNVSGGDAFAVFFRLDDFFAVFIYAMKENQVAPLGLNRDKPCFPLDADSFVFHFFWSIRIDLAPRLLIIRKASALLLALKIVYWKSPAMEKLASNVFIGAFGSVAVSGDGERIADHPWDVKFILPNNENIFESIIQLGNHLNKNNIRKRLKSLPAASMRFPRLEHT